MYILSQDGRDVLINKLTKGRILPKYEGTLLTFIPLGKGMEGWNKIYVFMKDVTTGNVKIEIKRGDIAFQNDIQAVVNAANAELRIGGGVAGAIHRAAGPSLTEETRSMAPIEPGEAVISGGHQLPNEFIIHCLGPVYGRDKPEDKLLGKCYSNALHLAEDHEIESIAFPAISTGAFGYPMEGAARVALTTIKEEAKQLRSVTLVRFVLWSEKALSVHEEVMQEVFQT